MRRLLHFFFLVACSAFVPGCDEPPPAPDGSLNEDARAHFDGGSVDVGGFDASVHVDSAFIDSTYVDSAPQPDARNDGTASPQCGASGPGSDPWPANPFLFGRLPLNFRQLNQTVVASTIYVRRFVAGNRVTITSGPALEHWQMFGRLADVNSADLAARAIRPVARTITPNVLPEQTATTWDVPCTGVYWFVRAALPVDFGGHTGFANPTGYALGDELSASSVMTLTCDIGPCPTDPVDGVAETPPNGRYFTNFDFPAWIAQAKEMPPAFWAPALFFYSEGESLSAAYLGQIERALGYRPVELGGQTLIVNPDMETWSEPAGTPRLIAIASRVLLPEQPGRARRLAWLFSFWQSDVLVDHRLFEIAE